MIISKKRKFKEIRNLKIKLLYHLNKCSPNPVKKNLADYPHIYMLARNILYEHVKCQIS